MPASVGMAEASTAYLSRRYCTSNSPHFPIWAVVRGTIGVAAVMVFLAFQYGLCMVSERCGDHCSIDARHPVEPIIPAGGSRSRLIIILFWDNPMIGSPFRAHGFTRARYRKIRPFPDPGRLLRPDGQGP